MSPDWKVGTLGTQGAVSTPKFLRDNCLERQARMFWSLDSN